MGTARTGDEDATGDGRPDQPALDLAPIENAPLSPIPAPAGGGGRPTGRELRSGLGWSLANTAISRAWTLVLGIILARILEPQDYGVYTVGLVVLNILQSMNELGVSVGIVRWPGDPAKPARTGVSLAAGFSVLLYLVCFLAAPAVAEAMGAPQASGVLRLLTLGVLLDGVSSIPNALLTRALLQRRRAIADIAALVVSTTVTLALATQDLGAWSLAWGALAGNATATTLVLVLAPARPRPAFDHEHARVLLRFGLPLAGASFMVFLMLNVDYVIVGRELGPVALGFYTLAFNLSSWPSNLLSLSIRRVSITAFSQLADDPNRMRESFMRSLTILMTAVIPVCILLSVLAGPLVRVVYGERWEPAVSALRYLAVLGGARVAFDFCYDLLVGCGRSRTTFFVQGLWVALLVPALSMGANAGGIRGVALAHAVVAVLVIGPMFLAVLHGLGIAVGRLARSLVRPALAGAVAGAVAVLLQGALNGDPLRLLVAGPATVAVYAILALPLSTTVGTARRLVRERRVRTEPASAR